MGRNQGVKRLSNGFEKHLTRSELAGGYIFISVDKAFLKNIFDVVVNGQFIKESKLDNSGRVSLGKEINKKIGSKPINIKRENKIIHINFSS
jgi:hypothetical protein